MLESIFSTLLGTPQYLSPDVVDISPMGYGPEVSTSSFQNSIERQYLQVDLWSVGCTVLEMITGEKPYHQRERSNFEPLPFYATVH